MSKLHWRNTIQTVGNVHYLSKGWGVFGKEKRIRSMTKLQYFTHTVNKNNCLGVYTDNFSEQYVHSSPLNYVSFTWWYRIQFRIMFVIKKEYADTLQKLLSRLALGYEQVKWNRLDIPLGGEPYLRDRQQRMGHWCYYFRIFTKRGHLLSTGIHSVLLMYWLNIKPLCWNHIIHMIFF